MSAAPGRIVEVNGPIVTVHLPQAALGEQVWVGNLALVGEVIGRDGERAIVQIYESTESLAPGQSAAPLGHPLAAELGPGLLGNIFDGLQRPLTEIMAQSGDRVARGLAIAPLDRGRRWNFTPTPGLQLGGAIAGGAVIGTVAETETVMHRILVPPDTGGELVELAPAGDYDVEQVIAQVRGHDGITRPLRLYHRWPVRRARPCAGRDRAAVPLVTGQRVLDTFFPLLKGGRAAVPGPFGAGKTMVQQQIARWADAGIMIYLGCGERGNELVEILETFPRLTDPHTGRSLMDRTLLVANTSNMPVVAREASIYMGVTLAEYYRDQGYDVVVVADSISRWAEALREVAGRLEQIPAEEGHPAYLASRLSAFYERAGQVRTLCGLPGSVSLIGAVSPPGGDFSEPVTSHTKDMVQVFWALSKELADARHYPAVDWTESYSGYVEAAAGWWADRVDSRWNTQRAEALSLLQKSDELARIVNLVGPEALSAAQRWVLEGAALIKEGLLQQSALDEVDSFCSPQRQFALLDLMLGIYRHGQELVDAGVPVQRLLQLPVLTRAKRAKTAYSNSQLEALGAFATEAGEAFRLLGQEYSGSERVAP